MRLRERVQALGPGAYSEERRAGYVRLRFPLPPGSEYVFAADVYEDLHDLQVLAELPRKAGEEPPYFWYVALERGGAGAFEQMLARFEEILVAVLAHPTRIRQTRKLLSWNFECEYYDGDWISVGGVSALRTNFPVRPIAGRERVYEARAWTEG